MYQITWILIALQQIINSMDLNSGLQAMMEYAPYMIPILFKFYNNLILLVFAGFMTEVIVSLFSSSPSDAPDGKKTAVFDPAPSYITPSQAVAILQLPTLGAEVKSVQVSTTSAQVCDQEAYNDANRLVVTFIILYFTIESVMIAMAVAIAADTISCEAFFDAPTGLPTSQARTHGTTTRTPAQIAASEDLVLRYYPSRNEYPDLLRQYNKVVAQNLLLKPKIWKLNKKLEAYEASQDPKILEWIQASLLPTQQRTVEKFRLERKQLNSNIDHLKGELEEMMQQREQDLKLHNEKVDALQEQHKNDRPTSSTASITELAELKKEYGNLLQEAEDLRSDLHDKNNCDNQTETEVALAEANSNIKDRDSTISESQSKIKELENQVKVFHSQVAPLVDTQVVDDLKHENQELITKINTITNTPANVKTTDSARVLELQTIIQQLKAATPDDTRLTKEEGESLLRKHDAMTIEVALAANVTQQYPYIQKQNNELRSEVLKVNESARELQQQLSHAQSIASASGSMLQQLQQENARLQRDLTTANTAATTHMEALAESNKRVSELETDCKDYEDHGADLNTEFVEYNKTIEEQKVRIEALQADCKKLTEVNEVMDGNALRHEQELKKALEDQENELYKQYQEDLVHVVAGQRAKDSKNAQDLSCDADKRHKDELETIQEELETTKKQLKTQSKLLQKKEELFNDQETEITDQEAEIDRLAGKMKGYKDTAKADEYEKNRLNGELLIQEEQIQNLKEELAATEDNAQELKELNGQVNQLLEQIKSMETKFQKKIRDKEIESHGDIQCAIEVVKRNAEIDANASNKMLDEKKAELEKAKFEHKQQIERRTRERDHEWQQCQIKQGKIDDLNGVIKSGIQQHHEQGLQALQQKLRKGEELLLKEKDNAVKERIASSRLQQRVTALEKQLEAKDSAKPNAAQTQKPSASTVLRQANLLEQVQREKMELFEENERLTEANKKLEDDKKHAEEKLTEANKDLQDAKVDAEIEKRRMEDVTFVSGVQNKLLKEENMKYKDESDTTAAQSKKRSVDEAYGTVQGAPYSTPSPSSDSADELSDTANATTSVPVPVAKKPKSLFGRTLGGVNIPEFAFKGLTLTSDQDDDQEPGTKHAGIDNNNDSMSDKPVSEAKGH